jgi:hypothetical protein
MLIRSREIAMLPWRWVLWFLVPAICFIARDLTVMKQSSGRIWPCIHHTRDLWISKLINKDSLANCPRMWYFSSLCLPGFTQRHGLHLISLQNWYELPFSCISISSFLLMFTGSCRIVGHWPFLTCLWVIIQKWLLSYLMHWVFLLQFELFSV